MKQLASIFIFVAIVSLSLFSTFLIFMHMPEQKARFFEQKASRYFYDSQDNRTEEHERINAAKSARENFIQALRNNPYDAALWIRLASVQKTLGNYPAEGNDTLFDAVRIAQKLRPDIKANLDRIIVQRNENNIGSANE